MNRLLKYLIIITIFLASTAGADDTESESISRFSGRLEAGAFYADSNSQVIAYEIHGLDKRIDDLGKSESKLSFAAPLLLFDINYEVKEDLLIYFGTPFFMDSREGLSLGAEFIFDNGGLFDISLFGDSSGVWKDPYLTGVDREFTYSHKAGLNIVFSDIMGSNFILNYVAALHEVEDDLSGKSNSKLERTGFTEKIKPGYTFNLTSDLSTSLTTSLLFERNKSEGNAYSYNKAGTELSIAYEKNQNSLVFSATAESVVYLNKNPVFNKRIKDSAFSGSFIFSRKNLWETNWYFRFGGGIDYLDSNEDFFDHIIYLTGISMGYSFE